MSDVVEKTSRIPSAKGSSKVAQIFAALWIAGWSAYKFISSGGAELRVEDIMLSGIGIAATFTPVYFSIILDKIKDIRLGKVD